MRFAAYRGIATDARNAAAMTDARCFACGEQVTSRAGRWVHGSGECILATVSKRKQPVIGIPTVSGLVWRYAPACLGGYVALYLSDSDVVGSGFARVKWAPVISRFVCDGTRVNVHVVQRLHAPVDAQLSEASTTQAEESRIINVTELYPTDEAARAVLQRFHSVGLLHLDPTWASGWRSVLAPPGGGKTTLLLRLVRQWPQYQFMLVTFARDIAEELRQRSADLPNMRVSTLDALCYATEYETSGTSSAVLPRLEDRQVIEECFPRCKPWFTKRDSTGVGPLLDRLARAIPLHERPAEFAAKVMCEKHAQYAWILSELVAPLNGSNAGIGRLRCSFGPMRARCARTPGSLERLRTATRGAQVLLIDEAQDMSIQSLNVLRALGLPVVAVGDTNQRVYDFDSDSTCAACARLLEESAAPHQHFGTGEVTMQLYATHRLDADTCRVLEEWTGLETVSMRSDSQPGAVRLVDSVPTEGPLMLLVRTNREVLAAAHADSTLGVVGAIALASELERCSRYVGTARRTTETYSAVERLAVELLSSGQLENICRDLRGRDAQLCDAMLGRIVCTVHRAKGAEAPNVAVHSNVLFPPEGCVTERCVSVVAASRHTGCLSVVASGSKSTRVIKTKRSGSR